MTKLFVVKQLPTLYKKNSKGKLQQWSIVIGPTQKNLGVTVSMQYGEVNGKLQSKPYVVVDGKNAGKKNATTEIEQAQKEALSKWKKQKNSGYVESKEDALAGKEDLTVVQGGIKPMLAHTYEDHINKVEYPCFAQPKLDGMRCIAVIKEGKVSLWSRERKPILSCPHIINELEHWANCEESNEDFLNCTLDGELYNHQLADEFEQIMSAVKKKFPTKESFMIQFHIYDGFSEGHEKMSYALRNEFINGIPEWAYLSLYVVDTLTVYNTNEVNALMKTYIKADYEGLMLRNPDSKYQNTRTADLLKIKLWRDDEFEIVNVIKGKDKSVIFICRTRAGDEFKATKSGNKDENQKYLKTSALWLGKKLNVKYFKFTKKNRVPKMGEARYIRED